MKKRTYVKGGVWHLGKGKRGGFFSYAGPLAGVLVGPLIEKVALPLVKTVFKEITGRGAGKIRRRRYRRRRINYV